MSTTDSDSDDNQYNSDMPSQPPPQPVGPNKVQELVEDNKALRSTMRRTAQTLSEKYSQMMSFYLRLKESSKRMHQAYMNSQQENEQQRRTIVLLEAEKLQLRLKELTINGTGDLDDEENDKLKTEYRETVDNLLLQLRNGEEERSKLEEDFKSEKTYLADMWEQREQQYHKQTESWKTRIQEDLEERMQLLQLENNSKLQEMQMHHEEEVQMYKNQVKLLIQDSNMYKNQLESCESQVASYKLKVQSVESRMFQASKEAKLSKEQNSMMSDEIIQLKQSLQEVRQQKNGKEESLDQLFQVYNKERDEKLQLEAQLRRGGSQSEEHDKVLAQYLCAEESLKRKNEEIANLKKRLENPDMNSGTQISVYKQQAEIYEKDFEMEREARQKVHQECEKLKNMVGQYQIEMQRMKQELMRYQAQPFPARSPYGS